MNSILYPQLIVTSIASWFVRNRSLPSLRKAAAHLMDSEKSSLFKLVLLLALQFAVLALIVFIQLAKDDTPPEVSLALVYVGIVVCLVAFTFTVRLLTRTREQAIKMTQEVYVEDIHDMFTSIRGQRHDFLNHMQVIHAMAQMNKTEQLKNYVNDLVKESHQIADIVNHSSPALAAFVQAKITVAEGRGIAFSYVLPTNWNVPEPSVKIIDVIKILGNLVDNGFDETSKFPPGERLVHALVKSDGKYLLLEVFNRGATLSEEEKKRILQAGYSTKGEGHSGLGLAIVQERVKHYNGKLDIQSDSADQGTRFRISIPYADSIAV